MNSYTLRFRQWPFPAFAGDLRPVAEIITAPTIIGVFVPGFRVRGLSIGCQSRAHSDLTVVMSMWVGNLAAPIVDQAASTSSDPGGIPGDILRSLRADSAGGVTQRIFMAGFHWRRRLHVRWSRRDAPRFGIVANSLVLLAVAKIPLPQTTPIAADLSGTVEIEPLR